MGPVIQDDDAHLMAEDAPIAERSVVLHHTEEPDGSKTTSVELDGVTPLEALSLVAICATVVAVLWIRVRRARD